MNAHNVCMYVCTCACVFVCCKYMYLRTRFSMSGPSVVPVKLRKRSVHTLPSPHTCIPVPPIHHARQSASAPDQGLHRRVRPRPPQAHQTKASTGAPDQGLHRRIRPRPPQAHQTRASTGAPDQGLHRRARPRPPQARQTKASTGASDQGLHRRVRPRPPQARQTKASPQPSAYIMIHYNVYLQKSMKRD
jgi:hypothetical protein